MIMSHSTALRRLLSELARSTPPMPSFNPASNRAQRPSQKQLDRYREDQEWGKVTRKMINTIKHQSRNYYTYIFSQNTCSRNVLGSILVLWYLHGVHPLPEDSKCVKYIVHDNVEYMDYVYGASHVLTVFISVADPHGRGRPPHLIGASSIETSAFYYCIHPYRDVSH
eukprot:SAG25_NODE_5712_length_628_cov_0.879017_1_plen_167_part_10